MHPVIQQICLQIKFPFLKIFNLIPIVRDSQFASLLFNINLYTLWQSLIVCLWMICWYNVVNDFVNQSRRRGGCVEWKGSSL